MFENLKWWKLTRDLESSKYEARRAALEELAGSDDERAPDLLLALLINEQEDLSLRRLAAEALAKKLDARAVRPMVKVLRKMDPTMAGWEPLVKALASMGAPAVKPLMEMLRDDDRSIRIIAIDELGRIGDERAAAPLLPLLLDGDPNMRMAAANALGEIGDARAVPPLLRLLGDPEQGPSNAAKLALQKLNWAPSGMPEFFHHFLATGHIP